MHIRKFFTVKFTVMITSCHINAAFAVSNQCTSFSLPNLFIFTETYCNVIKDDNELYQLFYRGNKLLVC